MRKVGHIQCTLEGKNMTKKTYQISNMTCGGCEKAVTRIIERTMNKATITIDINSRTLTVETQDGFEALEKALVAEGYSVQTFGS